VQPAVDAPTPAAPRRKAVRTILPIVIFAIIGVASALLATGLFFYNKATEPDRSTPLVATDAFLHALFVEESDDRVSLFTCSNWPASTAVDAVRSQIDPDAKVSWDSMTVADSSGDHAAVGLLLRFRYPEDVAPSGERRWTFDLVNESGWRVCGAHPAS
jgi:hypothetical protein